MGDRRMISTRIVEKGSFLKMPVTSQCLYFHLVARADDDGIVEALSVMNMCNLNEDDLRILQARGFVLILNEDLVTYIRDWRQMNKLRPDRKVNSVYIDLLRETLPEEEILECRPRSDTKKGRKSAREKILDGSWTAQENRIQSNPGQQNLIEDKTVGSQSFLLPSGNENAADGKMEGAITEPAIMTQGIYAVGDADAAACEVIAENIDLPYLLAIGQRHGKSEEAMVREIYDTICDMVTHPRKNVRIKEMDLPWETVRSRFMKLTFVHVSNILNRIIDQRLQIKNMHAYLISALYTETLCGTVAEQAALHDEYLVMQRGEPYFIGG